MRSLKQAADEHVRVLEASLESIEESFRAALEIFLSCLEAGGKVLVCGNGGSAADAQHFAAELVGRYERERSAWAAVSLSTDTSVITAVANDYGFEQSFARQVRALGKKGDVLAGISTSGNSENVVQAAKAASEIGMRVVSFTGESGGRLAELSDAVISVSSKRTARIQEIHEICLHALAEAIEETLG